MVPQYHNPTGLQEEGKHCKGLPDTNVIFIEKRVDDNPTKTKAKKFLKIGKIAVQALESVRNTIPPLFKDLVNKSKIFYREKVQTAAIHRFTNLDLNTRFKIERIICNLKASKSHSYLKPFKDSIKINSGSLQNIGSKFN